MRIDKVEIRQDKWGKDYKTVHTQDKKANVFQKDPIYSLCNEGAEIDAQFVADGKYWKIVRSDDGVHIQAPQAPRNNFSAAQERKAEDIALAQMNKDKSIQLSSSFRDATTLTVAQAQSMKFATPEEAETWIKDNWLNWREWLLANYDAHPGNNIPF